MIEFALIAACMLLASLVLVLWPLWRGAAPAGDRRREANVTVYHERYAEIEREVAAERITRVQAEQSKDELGARLLADVDEKATFSLAASGRRPWVSSAAVVAVFTILAAGLYGIVGDPRGLRPEPAPDIGRLIGQMQARIAAAPDDLQTRALLARVQLAQRKYAAAAQSYAAINARLDEPQASYLLAEARARVLSHDGAVTDRALALYERVLALSPDNAEALWYVGLAQLGKGRPRVAASHWQRLLEQGIPDDFRTMVERRLAQLRGDKPDLRPAN